MSNLPKLPIGISDFKKLREKNRYFVDKTPFIQQVWDEDGDILLFPRPRRFGKTLNLSMLRYFFENTEEDRRWLFEPYAIAQNETLMRHQGQYPMIYLTFKDVKTTSFQDGFEKIKELIAVEYRKHYSKFQSLLYPEEIDFVDRVLRRTMTKAETEGSVQRLMELLKRATQQNVWVLVDEYDAPIHGGHQFGFYDEMIVFMRNLLSGALKDNECLEKGVLTGILRIAKESIFSGLNNPEVYSLIREEFSDCFGFTELELQRMVDEFAVERPEELKQWYNGYQFGNTVIYNPWSILNFLGSKDRVCRPYWLNSSANELVRDLIVQGPLELKGEVEQLLTGETIFYPLDDNVVLRDLNQSSQTIWNLMVFSGYLKPVASQSAAEATIYELAIPNQEVHLFFRSTLQSWLVQQVNPRELDSGLTALIQGDLTTFRKYFRDMVASILSYYDVGGDEPEKVYHAFFTGLFLQLRDRYLITSNRESGYGRYDLLLQPRDPEERGFVIEFKKIDPEDDKDPESAMSSALRQIQVKKYATNLREAGVTQILGIGIVVEGKQVWVDWVDL